MSDIKKVAEDMVQSYTKNQTTGVERGLTLPDRTEVIQTLKEIRKLMFPAFFAAEAARKKERRLRPVPSVAVPGREESPSA